MALFHGKEGSATFGSAPIDNLTEWSIEVTTNVVEADVMGKDAMLSFAGNYTWTASLTGLLDDSNWDVDVTTVQTAPQSLVITGKEGTTYTGNAWLESSGASAPVDGMPTFTLNFKGSGTLTPA
jgi:hypothetical protein